MRVVVASRNPVKVNAVRDAFDSQFPGSVIELHSIDVDSGVAEQPVTDEETRRGARNRAENAAQSMPDADFWVGLEGGIASGGEQLLTFAWMAVRGPDGHVSECRSVTLPLPPAVKELVDSGLELGDANDRVFATVNSKQGGGAFGLLTNGRYTRASVYTQTLVIALVPFVNRLYPTAVDDTYGRPPADKPPTN